MCIKAMCVGLLLILAGCSTIEKPTGKPLRSLCVLDFQNQMCWTNKETNEGVPFLILADQTSKCFNNEGACTFAIDGLDLARVQKQLLKCTSKDGR